MFYIDSREVFRYTQKLQRLSRSAFPVAIRGTLNDAGFKMKKDTMPRKAKAMFEERQPNFFKANSRVEPAKGFDIKTMAATVGFVSSGLHGPATNYAVKDLQQQEHGGTIKGRSFKPLPAARKGGTGNVKPNARISKLLAMKNIVDARDSKIRGNATGTAAKMQQYIKASIHAGVGGYVLGTGGKYGGGTLWRVHKIRRFGAGNTRGKRSSNTMFVQEKLYSFKKSGVARVKATGFMRQAALDVRKEMEMYYKRQATRQIRKAIK